MQNRKQFFAGALLVLMLCATLSGAQAAPLVDEVTELHVTFVRSADFTTDLNEVLAVAQWELETNVRIVWDEIPSANAAEKINLKFASNDMPDVFINCGINQDMQTRYGLQQGMLAPLDDLIAQYAPTIQALLDNRPDLRKELALSDGHIYALPQLNEVIWNANPDNLFINTDWLETLGLAMPTTTEELATVLRAFKEGDPNGNGLADEIPLSFCYERGAANDAWSLTGAFGVIDASYNAHIQIQDGQLSLAASDPALKAALGWMHDLYAEGLIDIEAYTQDGSQLTAKGMAQDEILGAFFSFNPDTVVPYEAAYNHYMPVLPLEGPDGTRLWARNRPPYGLSQGAFAIAASSEKKELAMAWLNYINTGDNLFILRWGPFGVSVSHTEDGKVDMSQHNVPPADSGLTTMQYHHRNTLGNFGPYLLDRDSIAKVQWGLIQSKKLERYYLYEPYLQAEALPHTISKFMTEDEVKELSTLETNLNTYITQAKAKMVVDGFSDADWDAFVKQLDSMNVARYLEIYQGAYNLYRE